MSNKSIEISLVVPVYNSSKTLKELKERLEKVLRELVSTRYEIIFVNDGSADSDFFPSKSQKNQRNL